MDNVRTVKIMPRTIRGKYYCTLVIYGEDRENPQIEKTAIHPTPEQAYSAALKAQEELMGVFRG